MRLGTLLRGLTPDDLTGYAASVIGYLHTKEQDHCYARTSVSGLLSATIEVKLQRQRASFLTGERLFHYVQTIQLLFTPKSISSTNPDVVNKITPSGLVVVT